MKNNIVNFLDFNFEGRTVRIVDKDGNPWFVVNDVADCLEMTRRNARKLVEELDEDERMELVVPTLGGPQKTLIISESGLYQLVFKSRKPEARRFSKWVRSELIPQVRKTGSYSIQEQRPLSELEMIHRLSGHLLEQEKRLSTVEQKIDNINNVPFRDRYTWIKTTNKEVPELGFRQSLNILIKRYTIDTNGNYSQAWNDLYNQFKWRYSIDLIRRSKNKKRNKLDIVEELGMMEDLYALAKELFLSDDELCNVTQEEEF